MDRLSMPGAMPADLAEVLSDKRGGDIQKWALEQAREDLTEKLRDGEKVGGSDVWDLMDCEINSDRYRILLEGLGCLLLGGLNVEACDRAAKADSLRDGLIERYLSTGLGEEAVTERAEEILADRDAE